MKKINKLKAIIAPNPILLEISTDVTKEDLTEDFKSFIYDMIDMCYTNPAVGFAAVQFGVLKRVIVLDLGDNEDTERPLGFYPKIMLNPKITWQSENFVIAQEGCVSVPEIIIDVPRPEEIEVEFEDFEFTKHVLKTGGWLARVIQHEMDHLNGVTLLNYMSKLKFDLSIKKLKKYQKSLL